MTSGPFLYRPRVITWTKAVNQLPFFARFLICLGIQSGPFSSSSSNINVSSAANCLSAITSNSCSSSQSGFRTLSIKQVFNGPVRSQAVKVDSNALGVTFIIRYIVTVGRSCARGWVSWWSMNLQGRYRVLVSQPGDVPFLSLAGTSFVLARHVPNKFVKA
jgi:hypothetical protein